ncbi:MAG: hypothetical protein WC730_02990 [Patescibacteria group bacterium]|jgi:hypothetical protein
MEKLLAGDVFEVQTMHGLAYIQYIHVDEELGQLIKVFQGVYPKSLDEDELKKLAIQPERFYIYYPLSAALRAGLVEKKVYSEIETNNPPFVLRNGLERDGKVRNWYIYEPGVKPYLVEQLTDEQKTYSEKAIVNHTALQEYIDCINTLPYDKHPIK